jgi:hypothetical protein
MNNWQTSPAMGMRWKQLPKFAMQDNPPSAYLSVSIWLQMLGDPLKVLNGVELTLSNVLIPECTEGQTYDALYCDAALSEEDLPTFLALLKPNGRMVVIIEEVRSCAGSHIQNPAAQLCVEHAPNHGLLCMLPFTLWDCCTVALDF